MKIVVAILIVAAIAACQPAAKAPPPISAEQSATLARAIESEGGEVKAVQATFADAGYPMYAATFTLEGGATLDALLNAEEVAVEGGVDALNGKPVVATIAAVVEPSMLVMEAKGKRVMEREVGPDQKLEIPADAKTVTGILTGAKEPSGDLPNWLSIKTADGTEVKFREFFDERLAAHEGKEVTMTYDLYRFANVTALKAEGPPAK